MPERQRIYQHLLVTFDEVAQREKYEFSFGSAPALFLSMQAIRDQGEY